MNQKQQTAVVEILEIATQLRGLDTDTSDLLNLAFRVWSACRYDPDAEQEVRQEVKQEPKTLTLSKQEPELLVNSILEDVGKLSFDEFMSVFKGLADVASLWKVNLDLKKKEQLTAMISKFYYAIVRV
jgi:predicted lipase